MIVPNTVARLSTTARAVGSVSRAWVAMRISTSWPAGPNTRTT